ncbi:universal stress protein [Neopusillimonas aromaticivorans]|uniref:universal stress protein n=1 Tax=Neopusillimonas aromaticivorans TaxID=2979868 RepID=UPI0025931D12|nr:universal stress protein [Neopusillimonas aromaticivorans]WJJ93651.1 universal stress protein [Neopusillimonas aromaticivorans]
MNSILVPVDGSQPSLHAVQAAIAAARQTGAKVFVVTVQAPVFTANVKRFVAADVLDEYYHDAGEAALKDVRALLQTEGVDATSEIMVGPIAETIVDYAKKKGCDLIIMGTRGMGAISNLVLGSTALKVVSQAEIPVMLVK